MTNGFMCVILWDQLQNHKIHVHSPEKANRGVTLQNWRKSLKAQVNTSAITYLVQRKIMKWWFRMSSPRLDLILQGYHSKDNFFNEWASTTTWVTIRYNKS